MVAQTILSGPLLAAVVLLNFNLENGGLGWVSHLNAFILVLGGTLGYALMTYPGKKLIWTLRVVKKSFNSSDQVPGLIQTIDGLARQYRGGWGIRNLEEQMKDLPPSLLKTGLESIAYQYDREKIQQVLQQERSLVRLQYEAVGKILQHLSRMAVSMGLMGTVIYFIRFFEMTRDIPGLLGFSAAAFLTTLYGILFSKLGLGLLAGKVEEYMAEEDFCMDLIQEGVLSIRDREHPRAIRFKLESHAAARMGLDPVPREPKVVSLPKEAVLDGKVEPAFPAPGA